MTADRWCSGPSGPNVPAAAVFRRAGFATESRRRRTGCDLASRQLGI